MIQNDYLGLTHPSPHHITPHHTTLNMNKLFLILTTQILTTQFVFSKAVFYPGDCTSKHIANVTSIKPYGGYMLEFSCQHHDIGIHIKMNSSDTIYTYIQKMNNIHQMIINKVIILNYILLILMFQ